MKRHCPSRTLVSATACFWEGGCGSSGSRGMTALCPALGSRRVPGPARRGRAPSRRGTQYRSGRRRANLTNHRNRATRPSGDRRPGRQTTSVRSRRRSHDRLHRERSRPRRCNAGSTLALRFSIASVASRRPRMLRIIAPRSMEFLRRVQVEAGSVAARAYARYPQVARLAETSVSERRSVSLPRPKKNPGALTTPGLQRGTDTGPDYFFLADDFEPPFEPPLEPPFEPPFEPDFFALVAILWSSNAPTDSGAPR